MVTDNEKLLVTDMYAIIKEGAKCRDEKTVCRYAGNTIEHFLHSQGWLTRDLQIALCRTSPSYRASQRDSVPDSLL